MRIGNQDLGFVRVFDEKVSKYSKVGLTYISFDKNVSEPDSNIAILFIFYDKYRSPKPNFVYYKDKFWKVAKKDTSIKFDPNAGKLSIYHMVDGQKKNYDKIKKRLQQLIVSLVNN